MIERGLAVLLASAFLAACADDGREDLPADFLFSPQSLDGPVPTEAFRPRNAAAPKNFFEGHLAFNDSGSSGGHKAWTDLFGLTADPAREIGRLPPFEFRFIQAGNVLVPVERGPQRSEHPHWEFVLEPGAVWDEPGDGGFSRAAVPFSLQERNANCTHNGLLTFLFNDLGQVSRVAFQVGSETCRYLQVDIWGVATAAYWPGPIKNGQAVTGAHREQVAARLPVKPISALAEDYAGVDPAAFLNLDPAEVTTYGFVIDGVHYSGGCETRYGPHPFCAALDLPSYSLAKTVFAGSLYMWLEQKAPGAGGLEVTDYVPECRDPRWSGVRLAHLVDMASGNFEATEDQADEFRSYETDFIGSDSHARKIEVSCGLFERRAEPGSTFVYHSTETYIAGALMNAYLRRNRLGRDIHRDVLVDSVLKPLGLSPVTWSTRRTYDDTAQPFTGYGLTFLSDDIARYALFLMESGGMVGGEQVLNRQQLRAALQRSPADRGMEVQAGSLRYNNGLWALNLQEHLGCAQPTWVPFMSGYGGISVALIPNGSVYYVFSDGGHFSWAKAAAESNKINNYCAEP